MTDMSSYARAFACPANGAAVGIVRALAAGRLNGTRKRVASVLGREGHDALAQALLSFTPGKGSAWRPETGLSLLFHRNGANELAALQAAAACAGMGGTGQVEARFEQPQWLYLDGWLQPVQGECSLVASDGSIRVRSELGTATYSLGAEHHWTPDGLPPGPWRVFSSGGLAPRYVSVSGLQHSVEGFPWVTEAPPARPLSWAAPQPRIDVLHAGWRVILDKTPQFGPWVASTTAGCLLLEQSGSHEAQSGSSYDHPGLICIEPPDDAVFCGEILVHECSHQHMLVYTMVVPLVKPGSEEAYFSPIKRASRPVERVLSGAHAVGNMLLYYYELDRKMTLDAKARARFEEHRDWFAKDYRPALDQSRSLTEAGGDFWRGLCDAVDSAARS